MNQPRAKGSFRGAAFYTRRSGGEIGRRVALHVYPLRDKAWPEDMGRKPRKFDLDVFVCGPGYQTAMEALVTEFEAPGPGTLVHPYHGSMSAVVLQVRGPRESTRRGGKASFSVTFVEAGEELYPAGPVDTARIVDDQADLALDLTAADFAETFDVVQLPGWVSDAALGRLDILTAALDDLRRSVPGVPAAVTAFIADLLVLSSTAADLIRSPADLAWTIIDLISDVAALPDRPERAVQSYRVLLDLFSDDEDAAAATPSRAAQVDNAAALISLVRRSAAVETARTCSTIDYDSYTQAMAMRDEVACLLDAEMISAADDIYTCLADVRVAIIRDISVRGMDLPRLAVFTPRRTMPALVAAHMIYGDCLRDSDLILRNNIRHPGFVPGGNELEYLVNV